MKTNRRLNAVVLSASLTIAGLLAWPAPPASAYDAQQSQIVTANPADWTPNVLQGGVRYLAQAGNTMVAGGNFSQVENVGSSTALTRSNTFAFDASTGQVDLNYHPVVDGTVYAVVPAPDGQGVFLGGSFKHVNGVAKVSLVEVSLTDGSIVPTFSPPALNGVVYTLRLANNQLYAGGAFSFVGSNPIGHIAAMNPTTGAVDTAFHLKFAGLSNPQPTHPEWVTMVTKMDVSPDGSKLVAIGNFATVNGLDRVQIALVDLTTPTPTVMNWETDRFKHFCKPIYESFVHDVEFSPDGAYFVVGTTGGYKRVTTTGCDSTSRWETSAVGSALQPTWIDFTGGDTIWSIAVTATAVYTGGHNRWQNNPYASAMAGPGAVSRPGLAALDPATGVPFDWNPTRTTGVGVFDLLATSQGLWIGDDTESVGHELHFRLAFFPLAGGTPVPHPATGSLPGRVFQLGKVSAPVRTVGACGATLVPDLTDVVTDRSFDGAVAGLSLPLASVGTAWGQARGAFMLSGVLYTAWADGTFCRSTFNGTVFGSPTLVDLAPAGNTNKFALDIPKITGMFFSGNRIYYTMTKSTVLSYRYFSPQDDIVGALSYPAGGNVQGIDLSKVDGMFLSGSKLFFVTADGVLHRINWNGGGPVGGTSVALSGPGVNGDPSWTSQALFVYAPAGAVASNQQPYAGFTPSCGDLTCAFSNDGTWDSDGSIASYSWDFGDGTTSSAPAPTHTYANYGAYQATLTVTDNQGSVATATHPVTLTRAPQPPVASFSVSCQHLDCVVNGSASTDPDGTIASYSWNFGDGTPPDTSSATTSHTYAATGTYQITLTVTDHDGLTGSTTHQVSVAVTAPGISFLGESDANANGTSWSVQVPANVVGGDGLVLSASANNATADLTPSGTGWSLVASKTAASIVTRVWQKAADFGDAGSTVRFTSPTLIKANIVLLAYHGTDPSSPVSAFAGAAETATTTTHASPTVTVPNDGSWVVSLWADKSSATTTLTPPAGQTRHYFGCTTGSGRICSLLTDNGPASGGSTAGGLTAVADSASRADTMWTLVLNPAT